MAEGLMEGVDELRKGEGKKGYAGEYYGKLGTKAVPFLVDAILSFFPRRARTDQRRRQLTMLLTCFAHLRDADPPYFRLSASALASECGVSINTARRFIEDCEKKGIFERIGHVDRSGCIDRGFPCYMEGVAQNRRKVGLAQNCAKDGLPHTQNCAKDGLGGSPESCKSWATRTEDNLDSEGSDPSLSVGSGLPNGEKPSLPELDQSTIDHFKSAIAATGVVGNG
jgi:hypothetical protein